MNEHDAQQLMLLEELDGILQKLDPDHLSQAQRRVNRAIEVRRQQARHQALAEVRQISRYYGVRLQDLVGSRNGS